MRNLMIKESHFYNFRISIDQLFLPKLNSRPVKSKDIGTRTSVCRPDKESVYNPKLTPR